MLCVAKEAMKRGKLIILEGNIGVGKTTLSQELAKKLLYRVVYEPTAKNPYLALFYENPRKYALKLQLWIYRQRYLTFVAAVQHILETGQGVILDRSVYSDRVFAVVNRNDGNISEEGYRFYEELRLQSLRVLPIPHVTIYLDASPETCLHRIRARARDCESSIPLEYLSSLDVQYKEFLADMRMAGSCVLRLDWNRYGNSEEVCQAVSSMPTMAWTETQIGTFSGLVSSPAAVSKALTMPWEFAEASFDEAGGWDNAVEEAMLQRERALVAAPQTPSTVVG